MGEDIVSPDSYPSLLQKHGHTCLWCLMGVYVIWFGCFAWHDLYAAESIDGLYRTHHSPYKTAVGLVIDPRPNQSLQKELAERTGLTLDSVSNDWSALSESVQALVVDTKVRPLAKNELMLARDAQLRPLLAVNHYRGNWVIFRGNVGVILSTESRDALLKDVLILKATR